MKPVATVAVIAGSLLGAFALMRQIEGSAFAVTAASVCILLVWAAFALWVGKQAAPPRPPSTADPGASPKPKKSKPFSAFD